tara:strand:- start:563 stop:745 length:183 start_codon:yes stop_codon:yes gene_type:complete
MHKQLFLGVGRNPTLVVGGQCQSRWYSNISSVKEDVCLNPTILNDFKVSEKDVAIREGAS